MKLRLLLLLLGCGAVAAHAQQGPGTALRFDGAGDSVLIIHTNTLTENLADIQEKDRYDIVLANPPFGGSERKEIQQNFPIRTSETAFLFLQHFIKRMKPGGRGGIEIKN